MSDVVVGSERTSGGHMLHGSFWMISLRWALRLMGLVSTVILARLLSPVDFGVVAAAMVLVGMLEMFNQTGQKLALIRTQNPTREHYDSAWTISVLIGFSIGAAVFVSAPLTAIYFHDPHSVAVMRCLALRAVLGGFENIGIVNLRRDLQFDVFFRYNVYSKLASFAVTIVVAFALRNYWALVAGILTGAVATNVLSYMMSAYRPQFSLSKVREIWGFSIWTLVRSIGYYLNSQVDLLVIGGFASPARMGRYAVAHDVAASPTDEINGPMIAVLFPVMSRVQNDPEELRRLYLNALGWSALICASTSVGVAMVASDMVNVVLGPKWLQATHLIPWLALSAGVLGLSSGAFSTFDTLNMAKQGARMSIMRLFMLVIALAPVAFLTQSLGWIAVARLVVTVLFIPGLLLAVGRAVGVTIRSQIDMIWRPVFAAGAMALAIAGANHLLVDIPPARLVVDVILGSVVYASALFALWTAVNRPDSPEKDALKFLLEFLSRTVDAVRAKWASGRETPLNVCLYVAVPRSAEREWTQVRVHNFFRRNALRFADIVVFWRTGTPRLDHLHYRSLADHNKGDILIREAIRQQIQKTFAPRRVVFNEVGWGQLSDSAVQNINKSVNLFVIAGSGYLFFDEYGVLPERVGLDAIQIPKIRCAKIAYGVGCNYVIEQPTDNINFLPEIAPSAKVLIHAICSQLDAISARGTQCADIIETLTGRSVLVTGDPVLFYEHAPVPNRQAPEPGPRLRVGLNFAVHGRISVGNFIKKFETVCKLLRHLREWRATEFIYVCHLRADRIVPLLFRINGIPMHVRSPSPAGLAVAYRDLDLNICQMMHSSILSISQRVPTINLGYDVKNMTFFNLINLAEFCVPMASLDAERVLALAQNAINDTSLIRARIDEALQRLRASSDAFRAVLTTLCGDAERPAEGAGEFLVAVG